MKLSLIIAFIVFVVSLLASVVFGLWIVWLGPDLARYTDLWRYLGTSIILMLAALFYVPVGEAMNRILIDGGKSSSSDRR
jgi:hypothetical protein